MGTTWIVFLCGAKVVMANCFNERKIAKCKQKCNYVIEILLTFPNYGKPCQKLVYGLFIPKFEKKEKIMNTELIPVQNLIYEIRGKKVMLDFDLARLYQVETRALKQAVRRNLARFPSDFMFTLTRDEHNSLIIRARSQIVTSEDLQRNQQTKYMPFAFTEQGVAMLSSVLKSEIAIAANIAILRAFVRIRDYVMTTSALSSELRELRAKVDLLQLQQEENLGAVNDLSEDVRRDIDSLCIAIGELAEKLEEKKKEPRSKIGF